MDSMQPLLESVPWIPLLGNHEFFDGDFFNRYLNQTFGMRGGPLVKAVAIESGSSRSAAASSASTGLGSVMSRGVGQYAAGVHGKVPSNTSRWFSVDIGLVHFAAIDGNVYDWGIYHSETAFREAQLAWLRQDLAAAATNRQHQPWIVLASHFPMCKELDTPFTRNPTSLTCLCKQAPLP